MENSCAECQTPTSNPKFCSRSCSVKMNNRLAPKRSRLPAGKCCICGELLVDRRSKCHPKCRLYVKDQEFLIRWKRGEEEVGRGNDHERRLSGTARRILLTQARYSCQICGWNEINPHTGKCPLETDHINGDPYDDRFENLRVLCPNCHALTSTYKGANRGNGRLLGV